MRLIDPQFLLAGWRVGTPSHVTEEPQVDAAPYLAGAGLIAESGPAATGRSLSLDHALTNRGRVLAVVEANRPSLSPRIGNEQCLTYLRAVQARQGGKPP